MASEYLLTLVAMPSDKNVIKRNSRDLEIQE
jgi:hypothetical protein